MSTTFVKRGSVVQAEPFDPARTDQAVSVWEDEDGQFTTATMTTAGGRVVNVRPGDMIVSGPNGVWPCAPANFAAMYQPAAEALGADAVELTGGNQ